MTTPINTATTSTSTNIIDPMGLEKAMKLLEESLEKMQREFIGSVFKAAIKDQQALLDRYEKAVAEGKF